MDIFPFLTSLETDPDFDPLDERKAIENMRFRNRQIDNLLGGTISAEDLLDVLESTGVNPTEYANAVSDAVNVFLRCA